MKVNKIIPVAGVLSNNINSNHPNNFEMSLLEKDSAQLEKDRIALEKALADAMDGFNEESQGYQKQQQQQKFSLNLESSHGDLRNFKEGILQHIASRFGARVIPDVIQVIDRFNSEPRIEDKRSSLVLLLLLLAQCENATELTSKMVAQFSSRLKFSLSMDETNLYSITEVKEIIQSDTAQCSSLILANLQFEELLEQVIHFLALTIVHCDRSTLSSLISNDHVSVIDALLKNTHADYIFLPEVSFAYLQNSQATAIAETARFIFTNLRQKHFITDNVRAKRFYTLSGLFSLLLKKNAEQLWRGMLHFLRGLGDGFTILKQLIQEASQSGRLDFIVWALKLFQKRTSTILVQDDVFFGVLNQINRPNAISDILAILNQCYTLIVDRRQQEFLVEIFTAMLDNNDDNDEEEENDGDKNEGSDQNNQPEKDCESNSGKKNRTRLLSRQPSSSSLTKQSSNKKNVLFKQGNHVAGSNTNVKGDLAQLDIGSVQLSEFKVRKSYLLFSLSPIVCCALITRMFLELSRRDNSPLKEKLAKLAESFLNLLMKFSEELDDLRDWKILLFECVYPSHERLVDIAREHKQFFSPFLSINNIKSTMFIKWKSEFEFDPSILTCSSAWNAITKRFNDDDFNELDVNFELYKQQQEMCKNGVKMQLQDSPTKPALREVNMGNDVAEEGDQDASINSPVVGKSFGDGHRKVRPSPLTNSGSFGNSSSQIEQSNNNSSNNTWLGFYLMGKRDIKSIALFYQKRIVEHSILIRSILEAIFYFCLFLFLFTVSKDFIDAFTLFQKINPEYFTLSLEQKPPDAYASVWASTCMAFQAKAQAGQVTAVLNLDLSVATFDNYVQICQDNLVYQTCDIQDLIDYFQTDCESLLNQVIVMGNVGTVMEVMFVVMSTIGFVSLNLTFFSFMYLNRIRLGFFEILDIAITTIAIVIILHIRNNLDPAPYSRQERSINELLDNSEIMKEYLMYFFLLLWCRFISFLRKSEKLGSIVKTLELMVRDLVWFLIVLCIGLLAFSTFFYIGYGSTYNDYISLTQSIFSLTSTIFGGYNLEDKSFVAQTYIVIFLVIFNVVVLNLLIAILSNTYELVAEQGNMEYSLTLYDDYNIFKYNRYFSSVVSFSMPVGIITSAISPILYVVYAVNRNIALLVNKVSFHISYVVYLVLFFALFIGASVVTIPFAYLANIWGLISGESGNNGTNSLNGEVKNGFIIRIAKAFLWMIVGVPILVLSLLFNDIPLFLISCYMDTTENAQKIFDISEYEKPNVQYLTTIMRKITDKRINEAIQQEEEEAGEKKHHESNKQQQSPLGKEDNRQFILKQLQQKQTKDNFDMSIQKQQPIGDLSNNIQMDASNSETPILSFNDFLVKKNQQPKQSVMNTPVRMAGIEMVQYGNNQNRNNGSNNSKRVIDAQLLDATNTITCDEIRGLYQTQTDNEREKLEKAVKVTSKQIIEQGNKHKQETLWLDLFMKRISVKHETVNEAMLRQLLAEAKKSVLMTPRLKYYSPDKIISKQQELLSLIDIGLNQVAIQKFNEE